MLVLIFTANGLSNKSLDSVRQTSLNLRRSSVLPRRLQVVWVFVLFLTCGWHGSAGHAQHRRALTEEFRVHRDFRSKFLPQGREIVVWLPPGYDSQPAQRYPVLYLQDGEDVFVTLR